MIDYLTHYYRRDQAPFQSLSALSDEEALTIMAQLSDDTPYGARFKHPHQYLKSRQATEQWVRTAFLAKGGQPRATYPIAMVLGSSPWLAQGAPSPELHGEIRLPLTVFRAEDVSFTYPDSMLSHWFGREKPAEYYQAELHGQVFTLPEILALVAQKGLPEEDWEPQLPPHLAPYIEAQVWHHERLFEYWEQLKASPAR